MSSLFDAGKELLGSGRTRIGLTGLDKDKKQVTIDIDVVTAYTSDTNANVTSHPIEISEGMPYSTITDYVIPVTPTITIEAMFSSNLNIISSIADSAISLANEGGLVNNSVNIKDKIRTLNYWQRTGSVLIFNGYTTGSTGLGEIFNTLKRGYVPDEKLSDPFYVGLTSDVITNLVLGNIIWKQTPDLGIDVSATIELKKAYFAVSETGNVTRQTNKKKPPKRKSTKTPNKKASPKKKSLLVKEAN